jgi:hypothetical protein
VYAVPAGEIAVIAISPPMACIVAASVVALWLRRRRLARRGARLELAEVIPARSTAAAPEVPSTLGS